MFSTKTKVVKIVRALFIAAAFGAAFGAAAIYLAERNSPFAILFLLLVFGTGVAYFIYFAVVALGKHDKRDPG